MSPNNHVISDFYCTGSNKKINVTYKQYIKLPVLTYLLSTSMEQAVACTPDMQWARVQSLVGISFLGEVFSGFFLTCQGALGPHGPRISFGHHNHQYSFITGANDLRCWCTLKPQIYLPKTVVWSEMRKQMSGVRCRQMSGARCVKQIPGVRCVNRCLIMRCVHKHLVRDVSTDFWYQMRKWMPVSGD